MTTTDTRHGARSARIAAALATAYPDQVLPAGALTRLATRLDEDLALVRVVAARHGYRRPRDADGLLTACKRGHPFVPGSYREYRQGPGWRQRVCRVCTDLRQRARRAPRLWWARTMDGDDQLSETARRRKTRWT